MGTIWPHFWTAAVIIAPTRGSNPVSGSSCQQMRAGHHRPYEGQQHQLES